MGGIPWEVAASIRRAFDTCPAKLVVVVVLLEIPGVKNFACQLACNKARNFRVWMGLDGHAAACRMAVDWVSAPRGTNHARAQREARPRATSFA